MNVNFQQHKEADGTFTVIITFTDVPDEEQAQAAGNLIKRALMQQGAAGIMGHNPFEKKRS
jgi:hypothetical protein